jgi:hypothetical protein
MLTNLPTLIPDWLQALAILALLATPAANPILNGRNRRARARAARLNPTPASAVDAAVARVLTAGPEYSGNTIQLPCRECGRRHVPPRDHVDSPRLPVELTTLIENAGGWQITATCTACGGPLISRVLDVELAQHALSIGVVPAIRVDH